MTDMQRPEIRSARLFIDTFGRLLDENDRLKDDVNALQTLLTERDMRIAVLQRYQELYNTANGYIKAFKRMLQGETVPEVEPLDDGEPIPKFLQQGPALQPQPELARLRGRP